MYHALATVRDYNAAADTCSVELYDLGVIDVWLDGVKVNQTVPRSLLAYGSQVTVAMPDAHRICEAVVIGPGSVANQAQAAGAVVQKTQTGRVGIALDGTGHGSITVTYPSAFSGIPGDLRVLADKQVVLTLSNIGTSSFTVALGSPGVPNSTVYVSWTATGSA